MAERATVARPYARAAFGHAQGCGRLAEWGAWLSDARLLVGSDDYQALRHSAEVRSPQLVALIADVCGDALDTHGRAFLDLLAENGRVGFLPEIARHFDELRADSENVADVAVVSAVALDATQQARLAAALRQRLRRDIRLRCSVDASLIGGAVVRSGDLLIDGSMKAKLERLHTDLTS